LKQFGKQKLSSLTGWCKLEGTGTACPAKGGEVELGGANLFCFFSML
jgi:hypothetical protein